MTRVWVHWELGPGDSASAHALARRALARHAGIPAEAWAFAPGTYGKPGVVAPAAGRRWRFNLSHAPGIVAVALAEGVEVGVDAEDLGREGDFSRIAPRYFAPSEVADLRALPDDAARHERFFELWTLKEAYIKARGLGLAIPLDQEPEPGWSFGHHRASERHLLALAVCGSSADVRWEGAV